jgi:hypothetical protein
MAKRPSKIVLVAATYFVLGHMALGQTAQPMPVGAFKIQAVDNFLSIIYGKSILVTSGWPITAYIKTNDCHITILSFDKENATAEKGRHSFLVVPLAEAIGVYAAKVGKVAVIGLTQKEDEVFAHGIPGTSWNTDGLQSQVLKNGDMVLRNLAGCRWTFRTGGEVEVGGAVVKIHKGATAEFQANGVLVTGISFTEAKQSN